MIVQLLRKNDIETQTTPYHEVAEKRHKVVRHNDTVKRDLNSAIICFILKNSEKLIHRYDA